MSSRRSGWAKWQEGMKKLQSSVQDSSKGSSYHARVAPSSSRYCEDQSQDDLMRMLECPICLEIADSPPIFQCTEGHLLCKVWFRLSNTQ